MQKIKRDKEIKVDLFLSSNERLAYIFNWLLKGAVQRGFDIISKTKKRFVFLY